MRMMTMGCPTGMLMRRTAPKPTLTLTLTLKLTPNPISSCPVVAGAVRIALFFALLHSRSRAILLS
jgi:hypothetical protein